MAGLRLRVQYHFDRAPAQQFPPLENHRGQTRFFDGIIRISQLKKRV
jgi:hypothetical protein